jgi:hypothetical protein
MKATYNTGEHSMNKSPNVYHIFILAMNYFLHKSIVYLIKCLYPKACMQNMKPEKQGLAQIMTQSHDSR